MFEYYCPFIYFVSLSRKRNYFGNFKELHSMIKYIDNFLFLTNKMELDFRFSNFVYELPHELFNDLKKEIKIKSQNWLETQTSLHSSLLKLVFGNSCRNYGKAKQILGFSGLVQFFLIFLLFFKYFVTYTFFLIRMSKFSLMLDVLISLENFRPKLQMLLLFVFLKFANFNFNTSVRHIPFLHIFLLLQI